MRNFALLLTIVLAPFETLAQSLSTVSPLDFGRIAVIDNSSVGSITVDRFDNITYTEHFRVLIPGKAAVFRLSDIPPNTGFFFNATARSSEFPVNPGVETFTINSLNYDNYDVSDDTGNLFLKVGATISTSGNGRLVFRQEPYSAIIDLTFSF